MAVPSPAQLCALAAHLVFAIASVRLFRIDLREQRLPNRIIARAGAGILLLLTASAALAASPASTASTASTALTDAGSRSWPALLTALVSALCYGLVFLLLWLLAPNGVGAGDVKLAPLIGLVAGWHGAWVAALWVPLLIALLGGAAGLVSLARRRSAFAFGPVLLVSCWVGVILAGVGWIR